MGRKRVLTYGVGVNDASYLVVKHEHVNGKRVAIWRCPVFQAWRRMLERCYSERFQILWPTYVGCKVQEEWLLFSNFRGWMIDQEWHGKVLDKDLLVRGNKLYSQNTCVFIPEALNLFLTDHGRFRGDCPIGAYWDKSKGKFMALCRDPFTKKQEKLGGFSNPEEAHEAWRKRKHEIAIIYAGMQKDPRVATALMTRFLAPYKEIREV